MVSMKTDPETGCDETHPLLPYNNCVYTGEENDHIHCVRPTERSGYLFMLLGALAFCVHSSLLRLGGNVYGVPAPVAMLVRGIMHITFSIIYFLFAFPIRELFRSTLTSYQYVLLFFRGLAGSLALFFFYTAVSTLISVGDATAIYFIVPAFTLVLSRVFLSEPIMYSDVVALILSLVGAGLIANNSPSPGNEIHSSNHFKGAIMMVTAAFFSAVVYTIVRGLGKSISFMSSIFSFASFTIVASILLGAANSRSFAVFFDSKDNNGLYAFLVTVSAACSGFLAQCGFNLGLQRCHAGPGALMANTEVPLTYILAAIFLHEIPGKMAILGGTFIIISSIIIGVRKLQG